MGRITDGAPAAAGPVRLKVQPRPCIVPHRANPLCGFAGGWGRWGDDSFDLGAELARRQRAAPRCRLIGQVIAATVIAVGAACSPPRGPEPQQRDGRSARPTRPRWEHSEECRARLRRLRRRRCQRRERRRPDREQRRRGRHVDQPEPPGHGGAARIGQLPPPPPCAWPWAPTRPSRRRASTPPPTAGPLAEPDRPGRCRASVGRELSHRHDVRRGGIDQQFMNGVVLTSSDGGTTWVNQTVPTTSEASRRSRARAPHRV